MRAPLPAKNILDPAYQQFCDTYGKSAAIPPINYINYRKSMEPLFI
jgi:hypothetical protein